METQYTWVKGKGTGLGQPRGLTLSIPVGYTTAPNTGYPKLR